MCEPILNRRASIFDTSSVRLSRRSLIKRTAAAFVAALPTAVLVGGCGEDDEFAESGTGLNLEHNFSFVPYQGLDGDSNDEIQFSELFDRGVPVVLNFWAGQCPPCRAEMPHFQQIADEYGDELILFGLDVGVFTMLGTEDDALALLAELGISYPVGHAIDRQPLLDYNVVAMPTTVFFRPTGEVDDRRAGLILEDELRQKIDSLY